MKYNKRKLLALACGCIVIVAVIAVAFSLGDTAQVVIDPGHGGSDVGAEYNGRYEKDDNLAVALKVNEKLREMGIDSVMTRDDDEFISLEDRCKLANRKKAKAFVSIHRNSAENANGVEIWISSSEPAADSELAENIMDSLDSAGISNNRGVKSGYARGDGGDYYVNSHTNMKSCLVELGFITSEIDNELLDSLIDEYAAAMAQAIADSL